MRIVLVKVQNKIGESMSSVNLQRESRLKLLKEEPETTKQMTMTSLKSLKRLTKKKTKKMKTETLRA
jgi:hypothetical protein